jgi:hypothetical protein
MPGFDFRHILWNVVRSEAASLPLELLPDIVTPINASNSDDNTEKGSVRPGWSNVRGWSNAATLLHRELIGDDSKLLAGSSTGHEWRKECGGARPGLHYRPGKALARASDL